MPFLEVTTVCYKFVSYKKDRDPACEGSEYERNSSFFAGANMSDTNVLTDYIQASMSTAARSCSPSSSFFSGSTTRKSKSTKKFVVDM